MIKDIFHLILSNIAQFMDIFFLPIVGKYKGFLCISSLAYAGGPIFRECFIFNKSEMK
jgi:hypothetical protein